MSSRLEKLKEVYDVLDRMVNGENLKSHEIMLGKAKELIQRLSDVDDAGAAPTAQIQIDLANLPLFYSVVDAFVSERSEALGKNKVRTVGSNDAALFQLQEELREVIALRKRIVNRFGPASDQAFLLEELFDRIGAVTLRMKVGAGGGLESARLQALLDKESFPQFCEVVGQFAELAERPKPSFPDSPKP